MFGKNPIRSVDRDPTRLAVEEMFFTIQGEGPYSGMPALFIRMAGCNLACHFCFVGSTLITMADGTRKRIDAVKKGERVLSYDESIGEFVPARVARTMTSKPPRLLKLMFTPRSGSCNPNDRLVCTEDHPLLVRGRGWVAAKDLKHGDAVLHFSQSERMQMFNAYRPTEYTDERRQLLRESIKKTWKSGKLAGVSERMRKANPMKAPAIAAKSHMARKDLGRMTSAEQRFQEVTRGLPVEFTAGQLVVNNHFPDFCVKGKKKLIEVWAADARHARQRGAAWRRKRAALFAEEGYETLFVPIPAAGVRDGAFTRIRRQVAEFARNGDIFDHAEVIERGSKAWTRFAGKGTADVVTYNLEVDGKHTYLANNKVVHNCDTQFETRADHPEFWLDVVNQAAAFPPHQRKLVVITGGEPLRQNIIRLVEYLLGHGTELIQIETAGTLWQPDLLPFIESGKVVLVCSPKTPKVRPEVVEHCRHWKYIILEEEITAWDGLPGVGTQENNRHSFQQIYRPVPKDGQTIWVSPCDEYDVVKNKANLDHCVQLCLTHGYRLSLQVHKLIGMP